MKTISRTEAAGNARLKFVIVLAIIGLVAYLGFTYIPVAYNAYLFKDLMKHNANVAAAQGYAPAWVKDQLTKAAPEYGVPPDAIITPTARDNRMEVRVQFVRPIEFIGYTHEYEFDHTAESTAFLTLK
ncbi:MAG TPA: hypothetical protein VGW36_10040 [Pyrinomonadaceae bacterium]|nr:hypothetical protein [Pyrinomonadaceae bacterium]